MKPSREAIEAANKLEAAFHCGPRDVKRFADIIQSAIDKVCKAQADETVRCIKMADPIQVGGRTSCPKCGEDYSMADIHQCEPDYGAASSEPQERWTAEKLREWAGDELGLARILNAALDAEREKYTYMLDEKETWLAAALAQVKVKD